MNARYSMTRMAATALSIAVFGTAHAFTYSESASGDLSGDRLNPTLLAASTGTNSISMSSGSGDRDYFTFNVPAGSLLTSIIHKTYVSADQTAFFGFQAGTQLTEDPANPNPGNLLGYLHFGPGTAGTEIIDNLANSNLSDPPAMGFTPPLPAGHYVFWVQQLGAAASYSFDFVLRVDADADGVADTVDNCLGVANPTQADADGDGYGNRCDGDLNNNLATNAQDYAMFRPLLGTSNAIADLNDNGTVNAQDYAIFRSLLGSPPGPSGLHP